MSKRFTDTNRWEDPWFRKLSPKLKCFWSYMCDRCDPSGCWGVDLELASFCIGEQITEQEALDAVGSRIEVIAKDKWWIKQFIVFQYKRLSEACPAHQRVFEAIKKNGLDDRVGLGMSYPKARVEEEEEEEDKKKKKKKRMGDARGKEVLGAAEEIYQLYPRHVGRQAALKAICKALEHRTHEWLVERTEAYAASWAGQQGRFTPYPSTWFTRASYDDDPQQWEKPHDTDVPEGHDVNWKQNWKKLAKPKPDRSKAS